MSAQPSISVRTIPSALRSRHQWLLWKLEVRNDKLTKVPYSVHGGLGKSNDPATWAPFKAVVKAYLNDGKYSGIGVAFAEHDGLIGLDLDHVMEQATGLLTSAATEIVSRFAGTYCEISPSGTGLRIF